MQTRFAPVVMAERLARRLQSAFAQEENKNIAWLSHSPPVRCISMRKKTSDTEEDRTCAYACLKRMTPGGGTRARPIWMLLRDVFRVECRDCEGTRWYS